MLKKIYSKDGTLDIDFKDIKSLNDAMECIVPGTKIKLRDEKQRYKCIARNNRYIIVAKPFKLAKSCFYNIIDIRNMDCGRDNMWINSYNYLCFDDRQEALKRLNDPEDDFAISICGIAKVEYAIDEIWCLVEAKGGFF